MLEVGSLIDGKYRILQKIGQGGMSVVYLARNERANKQWAIKEVRKDGVHDYEVVKQGLVAEIDMLKRLSHPHLPSIIDVIDGTDSFLIVMDYVEGNPLDKAIEATGAQSQENVIDWAKQLCDVLGYLHSRQPPIIYRDMKPANVMLKPDGSVVLIDFGTAREYKNTSVADTTCLGTRGYAAPEQFGGMGQTDARTDIYCLGATMYHLVTGHNPCTYPYEMKPIREWNPQLSTGLESIILKCTQNNPDDRYQSCAELYYDLEHFQELDIENIRKNNFKWKLFLISCIMTVIMSVGTGVFAMMRKNLTSSTYDSYMEKGKTAIEAQEKIDNYKKAVDLDPSKEEAYISLLEVMTSDGILSDEEYTMLRNNTLEHSNKDFSNKTNINTFEKNNPEGFAKFASELGYACYFDTEAESEQASGSNASRAKVWFDKAIGTGKLKNEDEARAKLVSTMIQNRDEVTRKKKDGTTLISYQQYWNSIIDVMRESKNVSTYMQLKMSRYALNEIISNSGNFLNDGVKEEQITKVIGDISNNCNEIKSSGNASDNTIMQLYDEIMVGFNDENNNYHEAIIEKAKKELSLAVESKKKREGNIPKAKEEGN